MSFNDVKDVAYVQQDDLYNRKIQPVEAPGEEIGIDLERSVLNNIIDKDNEELYEIIKSAGYSKCVDKLINAAKKQGGADNITAVCITR